MAKNMERIFGEFVQLVGPIPQVKHVVAFPEDGGAIFAYVDEQDDRV